MGYIFVTARRKNTISCGLQSNFQKLNVHNLFICHLSNSLFQKQKGGESELSPPFIRAYEAGFIY
jgi:hypothetical protein